jgi:hypothetical protein
MSQLSYRTPLEYSVSDEYGDTIGYVIRKTKYSPWSPYKPNYTRIGFRRFRKPEDAQAEVESSFYDGPPDLGEPAPQQTLI